MHKLAHHLLVVAASTAMLTVCAGTAQGAVRADPPLGLCGHNINALGLQLPTGDGSVAYTSLEEGCALGKAG